VAKIRREISSIEYIDNTSKIQKELSEIIDLSRLEEVIKVAKKQKNINNQKMNKEAQNTSETNQEDNQNQIIDVYINYSTKDQEAKDYFIELFDKQGITYFLDEYDLMIGEDIEESLFKALKKSRFTIWLISENSLLSSWVMNDINLILTHKELSINTLLPILLDSKIFEDNLIFDIHYKFGEELEKYKQDLNHARELNMDTLKFKIEIDRLERIMPNIPNIFRLATHRLGVIYFDNYKRNNDIKKMIEIVKKDKI